MSLNTTPQTWPPNPSLAFFNTEIRDAFAGIQAAWDPYTPVLSGNGGTQPTVGDHQITGRYLRIGKTIIGWQAMVVCGSGAMGNGALFLTLPVPQAGNYPVPSILGSAALFDASSNAVRNRSASLFGPTTQRFAMRDESGAAASSTVPWTWAAGDIIVVTGATYEAA